MKEPHEEQTYARKFLLGYLDGGERKIVEERLTTDPDFLELVLRAESELMEDYVAGQLSEADRKRFDKYVLTNRQQVDQLNLTRALGASATVRAAANSPPLVAKTKPLGPGKQRSLEPFWTAIWDAKLSVAIILIILFGSGAYLVWRHYVSDSINPQQSLTEELVKLNTQQSLSAEAIHKGFIIGPLKEGLVRDEQDVKKFFVPETEKIVQLRLQIGAGDYQTFQAVLQTAEGGELLTLNDLKVRSINGERVVIVFVPAKVLPPGDYQIRLSGMTQNNQLVYLGRYTFQVVGK